MRFRWVYAKHYGHMDDNTVFKRSMLYEQFRIGAKKGCLIGSNNYQSDFCVITPQSLCTDIERDAQQVEAITKAHNTVLTAIQHLKNQFPVLSRIIQLPTAKVAKVVVLCTALYNLAKGQGDPIFNDVDEKEPSNSENRSTPMDRSGMSTISASTTTKHKAISYLVIGVNTEEQSRELFAFLKKNKYEDISLLDSFPGTKMIPQEFEDSYLYSSPSSDVANSPALEPDGADLLPNEDPRATQVKPNPPRLKSDVMEHLRLQPAKGLLKNQLKFKAAFMGTEIKALSGEFPSRGLQSLDKRIIRMFLAKLQVYAHFLEEDLPLETHHIIRFFNDCSSRYHGNKEWNELPLRSNKRKRTGFGMPLSAESDHNYGKDVAEEPSAAAQVHPDVKNESQCFEEGKSNEYIPRDSFDECEQKVHPNEFEVISATDLLANTYRPLSPMIIEVKSAAEADAKSGCEIGRTTGSSISAVDILESTVYPMSDDEATTTRAYATTIPQALISSSSDCFESLGEKSFRRRFRMSRKSFQLLCVRLASMLSMKRWQYKGGLATQRIAAALEILAGNKAINVAPTETDQGLPQAFSTVLDALAEWARNVIKWPNGTQRKSIDQRFRAMIGVKGVVGCLAGAIVGATSELSVPRKKECGPLNVGVVVDDKMMFRWAFKGSALFDQLCKGTETGILIGDDAYRSEEFLLTPKGDHGNVKRNDVLAGKLRATHSMLARGAITNWKRQYPILNSNMRALNVGKVVMATAALYNLTRAEGEPPFLEDE
ncbi:unnamed protein product [Nippostrongylus brasiliensis]|uniref:DDE Tnp4 domain-containing protein n=1 Tax=Nippostrongylus brasiliensis TaxID=27835 RepID=A0A158R226_NIPBR|nr:unnamed protein product [Nippostrongylus brasiliensis]